jgi:hypothetical protein
MIFGNVMSRQGTYGVMLEPQGTLGRRAPRYRRGFWGLGAMQTNPDVNLDQPVLVTPPSIDVPVVPGFTPPGLPPLPPPPGPGGGGTSFPVKQYYYQAPWQFPMAQPLAPPISTQPLPPPLTVNLPPGPTTSTPPYQPPMVDTGGSSGIPTPGGSGGGGGSGAAIATDPTMTVEVGPSAVKKPWWPWALGLAVVVAAGAAIAHSR